MSRSCYCRERKLTKATVDTGAELEPVRDSIGGQTSGPKRHFGLPKLGSRRRRLVTRVELNDTGREFLEASLRAERARRRRTTLRVVSVIAILAIAAVIAVVRSVQATSAQRQAQDTAKQAIAAKLVSESRAMLLGGRVGGDRRAVLEMLTAEALIPGADRSAMLDTLSDERRVMKIIATPSDNNNALAVNPDGREIVSAGSDHMVRRWELDSGKPVGEPMAGHTGSVDAVAYSKDGRRIASGGEDKTVRIWDAHSGAPVHVLTAHDDYVTSVAFNPDGSLLASASRDGSIRLWNTATGERVGQPIFGHDGKWVLVVEFSPDGALLASAGSDGTVRLWGIDPRRPHEQLLATHRGPVLGMAFSPDGRRIAP